MPDPGGRPALKAVVAGAMVGWAQRVPGLLLVGVLAVAAVAAATLQGGPLPPYALFFGMVLHHLGRGPRQRPGIDFCARDLLRLGVALLGARITAEQVAALGWQAALWLVVGVASTLLLALWLGPRLGLGRARAVLAGAAVGICGASAALAVAAVLPGGRKAERDVITVVVCITLLSTASMVLYPLLARALQLSPAQAGLFLGGSIHDVAQAVGAGLTLGAETGNLATVVKLCRVALLGVVVLAVSLSFASARAQAQAAAGASPPPPRAPLVPWFLWAFGALVVLNSAGQVSPLLQQAAGEVSRACLALAMVALGMKTSLREVARAGWPPLLLITAVSLWLAGWMLGGAWWLLGPG